MRTKVVLKGVAMNGLLQLLRWKKPIGKKLDRPCGPFGGQRQAGMSMIEIMIVIALIGTLMTIIVRNVTESAERAKEDQAKIGMNMLIQDLQRYRLDNNKYPTTEQGLNALIANPGGDAKNWRGPYTEENKINDPWQNPYQYESDGRNVKITSGGSDGSVGTADDVVYPEAKKSGQAP
jgi:general secretion pathway protein G